MSGKKKLEDSDEDMKVWDEFQNQLDVRTCPLSTIESSEFVFYSGFL